MPCAPCACTPASAAATPGVNAVAAPAAADAVGGAAYFTSCRQRSLKTSRLNPWARNAPAGPAADGVAAGMCHLPALGGDACSRDVSPAPDGNACCHEHCTDCLVTSARYPRYPPICRTPLLVTHLKTIIGLQGCQVRVAPDLVKICVTGLQAACNGSSGRQVALEA